MYSYKKEHKMNKRRLILALSCLLVIAVTFLSYEYALTRNEQDTAVFKEEAIPVLALPNTVQKGIHPYDVEANIILEYFDGKDGEIANMTKFEGVYRANQGIDYALDDQAFKILAIFSGNVSDVSEDPMFGKSVTITNGDLAITYQSLADIAIKQGDSVNQGDVIAKASTNIYNKDLGNHLHVVVEKNGVIIDPKSIYEKTLEEIK